MSTKFGTNLHISHFKSYYNGFCVCVETFTWSDTAASCCWSVRLGRVEVLSRVEKAEVTRLEAVGVGDTELMWPPLVRTDWPLSSPQPLIYAGNLGRKIFYPL